MPRFMLITIFLVETFFPVFLFFFLLYFFILSFFQDYLRTPYSPVECREVAVPLPDCVPKDVS